MGGSDITKNVVLKALGTTSVSRSVIVNTPPIWVDRCLRRDMPNQRRRGFGYGK